MTFLTLLFFKTKLYTPSTQHEAHSWVKRVTFFVYCSIEYLMFYCIFDQPFLETEFVDKETKKQYHSSTTVVPLVVAFNNIWCVMSWDGPFGSFLSQISEVQ